MNTPSNQRNPFSELKTDFWAALFFLLLTLFALRNVLLTPGIINSMWDWSIQAFPDQAWVQVILQFSSWQNLFGGGEYAPVNNPFFHLFTLPFTLLGGEFESKILSVLLVWGAAISMYWLARKSMRLSVFWSCVAAVLYMFSPVVYSRLLMGHLPILLGYVLLPLLVLFAFRIIRFVHESGNLPAGYIILTGLILGIEQALHQSTLVIASIVVVVLLGMGMLQKFSNRLLIALVVLFFIGGLLNVGWVIPFGKDYLSSGTIFHGSIPEMPSEQVTLGGMLEYRKLSLDVQSQRTFDAFRFSANQNFMRRVEYFFPVPAALSDLWTWSSLIVPIIVFGLLLLKRRTEPYIIELVILGFIGVTMVTGNQNLPSTIFYQVLKTIAPPVWAEFGSTNRAYPLVAIAYAPLLAWALQQFTWWVASVLPRVTSFLPIRFGFACLVGGGLVIGASPFLLGDISRPGLDDYALNQYSVTPSDQALYDFLKVNPNSSRILLPPPWYSWSPMEAAWIWDVGSIPPRLRFVAPNRNPRAWQSASDYSLPSTNTRSGKILGLAAVQYLVYPYARLFENEPYLAKYKARMAYGPIYDARIASQQDFVPVTVPFTGTRVYENTAYLPRIYAAQSPVLIDGSSNLLATLATTPYFAESPALFFTSNQAPSSLPFLAKNSEAVIMPLNLQLPNIEDTPSPIVSGTQWSNTIYLSSVSSNLPKATGVFTTSVTDSFIIRASAEPQLAPFATDAGMMFTQTVELLHEIPNSNQWKTESKYTETGSDEFTLNSDSLYDLRREQNGILHGHVWLNAIQPSSVDISKSFSPFDLDAFPNFKITTRVEDPSVQMIEIRLGLNWDGSNNVQDTFVLPLVPKTELASSQTSLLAGVRDAFPVHSNYRVVNLTIRLTKRPNADMQRNNQDGLYAYDFGELIFVSDNSRMLPIDLSAAAITSVRPDQSAKPSLTFDFVPRQNISVRTTRSLSDSMLKEPSKFVVDYQVDGPNALSADWQLNGTDAQGNPRILSLGTRFLPQFSEGTLIFDVPPQPDLHNAQLDAVISSLRGSNIARGTTLTLPQFRVVRHTFRPYSESQPPPPNLRVDDKPVTLSPIPARADRSGKWFSTAPLELKPGSHTFSTGYADALSPYQIDTLEIAPANFKLTAKEIPTLTFRQISPARFVAHVEDATTPFFLVFSEAFSADWQAFIATDDRHTLSWYEQSSVLSAWLDRNQPISDSNHFLVNGFANSWYIDKLGQYDVVIEFVPQRLYEGGTIVALSSFVGFTLALIGLVFWKVRRKIVRH